MATFMKTYLPLFRIVILVTIMTLTNAQRTDNEHKDEEPNPLIEAAKALLQDQLQNQGAAQAVTGLLQNFMQTDGGRNIGDMLLGAAKSNNGANAVDILSGLGSILSSATAEQGKGNEGGIDPQLIGQMVSMFASQAMSGHNGDSDSNVDINNNEIKSGKGRKKVGTNDAGIDWESMIGLASNFMASQGGAGGGWEGLLNMLPALIGGGDGSNEVKRFHNKHQQHKSTSYLHPFMETLYDYWEHFKSSELGQTVWRNSGLEATAQIFTDEDGHFEMERIFGSLENGTFRRRWIKNLSSFVAEWISHISDPATQTRYLTTLQFVGNGFLKAQGYHKGQLFDPARPAESLSHLVNAVFKRQFGLKVNSATYIRPAIAYIQEVLKIGQRKGISLSHLSSHDIENKLAETLNGEVIEPMLRVWRAYRYGTRHPQCDRYVICAVNQLDPSADKGAGLRPGITKLASITASWFLSSNTSTPFWKLYSAATDDHNCQVKYPVDCSDYHTEDIKATTEYAHSEL
ncbi:uncharacterized protein LOC110832943 isoform X1 [Zootermopsis nevadensis]|uniref:uncharacterized protein LOC110832943 isoform X1 n=2 Tax=Zootermopsis nevadensis TaxID=136037 RepID=UPI000B8E2671|nr:uncharacterized protein LOC110832943 isoform X1 [Zootermopsis nevadensis]